jgi:TonB family protein
MITKGAKNTKKFGHEAFMAIVVFASVVLPWANGPGELEMGIRKNTPTFLVAIAYACPLPIVAERTRSFNTHPGKIEQKAGRLPWPEHSFKRTKRVAPSYPTGIQDVTGIITVQATLDTQGHVAESRPLQFTAFGSDVSRSDLKQTADAFAASAIRAVNAWQYENPTRQPATFMMNVVIRSPSVGGDERPDAPELYFKHDDPAVKTIREVRPRYPILASREGIQGVIVLDATISREGKVADARVLRAIPYLDQAALDAVAQWDFDPKPLFRSVDQGNAVVELRLNFGLR